MQESRRRPHTTSPGRAGAPADPVRALRDRTGTTRLMILAELHKRPGATLSDVAQTLGITVQAVSAHARSLAADGRLRAVDGAYRIEPRGIQALHEGIRALRDAVHAFARPLDVIQVASAVALEPVRAGQQVGLVMVEGDLAARAGPASSTGIARNSAKPGQEVVVAGLKGIVQLEPGRLTVLAVPGPAEGGAARTDAAALRRVLARRPLPARVGAHGTGARILARAMAASGALRAPDFEFAADRAAFNAAERGLDVLLLVTRDRLAEVMEAFARLNDETLRRVPVDVLDAPEREAGTR